MLPSCRHIIFQNFVAGILANRTLDASSSHSACPSKWWNLSQAATRITTSRRMLATGRREYHFSSPAERSMPALDCARAISEFEREADRKYWVNLQPGNVVIDLLLLRLNLALYRRIGHRPACASRGIAHVSSQVERHVGRPLENKSYFNRYAEMLAATRNQIPVADYKHWCHRVEVGFAAS